MTIEQKEYEFSYAGSNYIDVNTLLTSQFHFLAIINELQKELYPDNKLNIKVKGFKEGSFVVQLVIEGSSVFNLLHSNEAQAIEGVLGAFASLITLYIALRGNKASDIKEDGNNITVMIDGSNTPNVTINKNVFNIYTSSVTVNTAIQKNFELLDADQDISGIKITETKKDKPILSVPRDEFEILSNPNKYLDRETWEQVQREQVLFIKEPNLYPEKGRIWVWRLFHKGRDIKAKILDPQFMQKINDGLKIGQGDRLIADLRIYYKWDETFKTYIESNKFDVIHVYKIVERSDQSKFDFNG